MSVEKSSFTEADPPLTALDIFWLISFFVLVIFISVKIIKYMKTQGFTMNDGLTSIAFFIMALITALFVFFIGVAFVVSVIESFKRY